MAHMSFSLGFQKELELEKGPQESPQPYRPKIEVPFWGGPQIEILVVWGLC